MIFGPRSLFVMAVTLLTLAGLYAAQRRATPSHREPPKPKERIGGRWDPKEVHAFQLFHGKEEHDSLVLERTADGWILRGQTPIRADSATVDRFLETLKDLEGEKREVGGKEAFQKLGLDDESAIRILLVDQNRRPLLNLMVGVRADASTGTFVRLGDDETVWLSAKDLRDAIGVDHQGHLGKKRWLDLTMVGLRADEIDHLTLRGPENILMLERREKTDPADPAKVISEWVLVAPVLSVAPKPAEVAAIASSFAGLRAEDVPDPSKIDKTGLETPAFEARAKRKGGQEVRVLFGSVVPGMEGQRYAKVAGRDQVYVVSKWDLQDVFRPIGRLADLPSLGGSKDRIVRVTLRDAWKEITFLREVTGVWRLEPNAPLAVRVDELLEMIGAALEVKPADLLTGVSDETAGLASPESEISMEDSDGRAFGIRLGGMRLGNEQQRYARMSNYEGVVALATHSISGIFPGLKQLLDLRPLLLERGQIRSITVETAGGQVLLEQGEPWKATVRDVSFDARKSGVDRLLSLAADFRPVDVATRAGSRKPETTVRFRLGDGREIPLRIGRLDEAGKELFARVGEDPLLYRITHFEFELATFSISDLADLTWPPATALARASEGVVASEKGEQVVSKESLKPLKVVAVIAPVPDSGIEETKERLTVILEGAPPLVLRVGGEAQARGWPGSRYARVEGSEALLLLREEEVAELFKPVR